METFKPKKINIEVQPLQSPPESQLPEVTPIPIQTEVIDLGADDPIPDLVGTEIVKSVNVTACTTERLEQCNPINDINTLKQRLIALGIRFDTDPKLYQKADYWLLVCILYRSLIYLYEEDPQSVIVTEWLNPHNDHRVPSEKLVAETIEELNRNLSQETLDRIQAIADEAASRLASDQELSNALSREISRLEGLIGNINDVIPDAASASNQLADKEFVHDQIATNASNFRGDWANWTSVPTDPQYYPEDYTGNKKPNNNDYLIIQNATDYDPSNTGIWRFVYKGDWDTLGKSGWEPQYRVEQAFTQEQLAAINSGITSQKVSTYDNYQQQIDNLLPLIYAGL